MTINEDSINANVLSRPCFDREGLNPNFVWKVFLSNFNANSAIIMGGSLSVVILMKLTPVQYKEFYLTY